MSILSFLSGIKNKIVHFFTDTKAGQVIEHVAIDIISVPGLHDFIVHFRDTVTADLKAALSAIEHPTSDSVAAVIEQAIVKLKTDAEAAVKDGLLEVTHAGWANLLIS